MEAYFQSPLRLSDQCSVLQVEISAIHAIVETIRDALVSAADILILSDSQTAVRALGLKVLTLEFCINVVDISMNSRNNVAFMSYEFALNKITVRLFNEFATEGIPLRTCGHIIDSAIMDSSNGRWVTSDTGITARKTWPELDGKCSGSLFKFSRMLVATQPGPGTLGK